MLLLPQGIALFSLLRHGAPALLWPLTSWVVGLGLGIIVDLFTIGLAIGLGSVQLGMSGTVALQPARSADVMVRLTQFLCDNLSGTFAVPFFALAAYRQ